MKRITFLRGGESYTPFAQDFWIQPLRLGNSFNFRLCRCCQFMFNRSANRFVIREDDLVNENVAPAAALGINDRDSRGLASQITNRPKFASQRSRVLAGCRSYDFSIDFQIHAGLASVRSTADQETDCGMLNREFGRSQFACLSVAGSSIVGAL